MGIRRSEFDVTNRVDVSDASAVSAAICDVVAEVFPGYDNWRIKRACYDLQRLFHGEYPGFLPCETP